MERTEEPDEADVFTQEFWDERYAAHDHVWSGRPNQRLVEHAAELPPGRRSTSAAVRERTRCGWPSGAGASPVPTCRSSRSRRPRQHAGEAGVADRTTGCTSTCVAGDRCRADADLVSAMYVHVPEADFDRVYAAIAAAVRPGGTLLVAGHHPAERDTDLRNPHLSHLLFAPERVTSLLGDGWRVDVAEAAPATWSDTTASRGSRPTRSWWPGAA